MNGSVRPSVCPSVRLSVCLSVCHTFWQRSCRCNFRKGLPLKKWCPCKRSRSEVKCQRHRSQKPIYPFPNSNSSLNSHMAMEWCTELDVALERCPIIFQGHPSIFKVTGDKNANFDPNWAFPDGNSSFNSLMATKWYTKLEVAKKRCPIVFRSHP